MAQICLLNCNFIASDLTGTGDHKNEETQRKGKILILALLVGIVLYCLVFS